MAPPSSKAERGIPFATFAADVERRRIATGVAISRAGETRTSRCKTLTPACIVPPGEGMR